MLCEILFNTEAELRTWLDTFLESGVEDFYLIIIISLIS